MFVLEFVCFFFLLSSIDLRKTQMPTCTFLIELSSIFIIIVLSRLLALVIEMKINISYGIWMAKTNICKALKFHTEQLIGDSENHTK